MDRQTIAKLRAERRLLDRAIAAIERYQQFHQECGSDAESPRLQLVWRSGGAAETES